MTGVALCIIYLAVLNAAGFFLMAWDKRQAMSSGWRVKERTLLGAAIFGGGVGVFAAMRLFRHKTQHWRFWLGVPVIMALQVALLYYLNWV